MSGLVEKALDFYLSLVRDFKNVEDEYKTINQFEVDLTIEFICSEEGVKIELIHRIPNSEEKMIYGSAMFTDEQAFEFLSLFNRKLKMEYNNEIEIHKEFQNPRKPQIRYNYFYSLEK